MDDAKIDNLYKIDPEDRTATNLQEVYVGGKIVCPDKSCKQFLYNLPVKTTTNHYKDLKVKVPYKARPFVAAKLFEAGYSVKTNFGSGWDYNEKYPDNWNILRKAVYYRDDYTCQNCRETDTELHAHHKEHIEDGGNHDLENLTTLCHGCHENHHGFEI